MSFGAEAEEEEDEVVQVNKKFSGKGKSSHDLTNDPKLSSELAIEDEHKSKSDSSDEDDKDKVSQRELEIRESK